MKITLGSNSYLEVAFSIRHDFTAFDKFLKVKIQKNEAALEKILTANQWPY